jgi:hypothetical protein
MNLGGRVNLQFLQSGIAIVLLKMNVLLFRKNTIMTSVLCFTFLTVSEDRRGPSYELLMAAEMIRLLVLLEF